MSKYEKSSNTYHKANVALGITAVGLVAAFPFQTQFWGGLITSGCSAGLVGGLADWFAVTALFRKPLGIRPGRIIRTEIIPRNRERIFQELTHMVQDELLSQEALTQKLADLDYMRLFANLTDAEGLAKLEPSIQALVSSFFESINQLGEVPFLSISKATSEDKVQAQDQEQEQNQEQNRERNQELERKTLKYALSQILREVYKLSLANGTVEKILEALVQELNLWIQSPEMHRTLQKWIDDALDAYVSENSSRKIVQMFLPESSTLASKLQMQIVNELAGGQAVGSAMGWLAEFVDGPHFDELIDHFLPKVLEKGKKSMLSLIQPGMNQTESAQKLTLFLLHSVEKLRLELEENAEKRVAFNRQVQTFLSQAVAELHDRIGRFVRDGLEKYSNEMLVSLIEDKAGDDLQMIRINGSVVGGLAGMLFYLVNFLF
jgi:uncharacterized membrane-anchored protein YjiN (DUF445 family)